MYNKYIHSSVFSSLLLRLPTNQFSSKYNFCHYGVFIPSNSLAACISTCLSFQCLTNLCLILSRFELECNIKEYMNFTQNLLHSLQVFKQHDEKPYASPTTHFEACLISKYHCNHVRDTRKGNGWFNRLAHLGEISISSLLASFEITCSCSVNYLNLYLCYIIRFLCYTRSIFNS